ncbi:DUF2357 domain-containing protein [Halanaerobaculum tunisiense]
MLTGQINFRNDIGYSELKVRSEGSTLATLKIEVSPTHPINLDIKLLVKY